MTVGSFSASNPSKPLSQPQTGPISGPVASPVTAPRRAPDPVAANTPSDQFHPQQLLNPSAEQPIISHLQVDLQDKDGLANFGQNDIKATVSGDVLINSTFLLAKLNGLKSDKDKAFHPPRFDAERRQYVISGTAINKILGLFDIGFEIRLGAVNGNLAFRVDSGLKRGSIYGELTKMLKEQGLATYEKDGQLFIKPEYHETITLPALANQPARIEKVGATADNLRFEIAADGQIKLQLKQVPVEMSSQTGVVNPLKATPDRALLKVDLGLDKELHPTANLVDGQITAHAGQGEIEKYLPGQSRALLAEQLGTALTVGLTGLHGQLTQGKQGIALNTSGQVLVSNREGTAHVSAGLNAALRGKGVVFSASQADVLLKDGSQVKAASIRYDGSQPGLNLQVRDLDGHTSREGMQVNLEDITGTVTRSESGVLQASVTGKSTGHVDQKGLQADFHTQGAHTLKMQGDQIQAEVEQADVTGDYQQLRAAAQKPAQDSKADPTQLQLKVKQINASGKVSTPDISLDAQASQGSLQVDLGRTVSVKTTARMNLSAQGEKVNGQATLPQGAEVSLGEQGLQVNAQDIELQGKFDKPGKLKVDGSVRGDLDVHVDKAGKVQVHTDQGHFDARFALKDKVKVAGQGEAVAFAIDAKENIDLDLGNTQAQTEVTAGKTRLKANTTGAHAHVSVLNDDVTVQTTGTHSTLSINVNDILQGAGKAGDVTVKVDSGDKGDDIQITAKEADVKARIQNKKGNLKVGVDAKADVNVHVDRQDNVIVSSTHAQSKVDLQLKSGDGQQDKIKVKAQGSDFNVRVGDDDKVGIELKQASFNGHITPNQGMAVDVASTSKAPIQVSVADGDVDTDVNIHTGAAVKGSIQIENKIDADFSNPTGFDVQVKDKPKGTDIHTRLKGLELRGQVNTPDAKVGVDGKGDFDLQIRDDDDVQVLYDGHLLGDLQAGDQVAGRYGLQGKVQVDVHGSDVDVHTTGSLQSNLHSQAHGVGADVLVNGQSSPIRVQVQGSKVSVNVKEGGQIQVKDLKQLQLGQPDPKLNEILNKLESQNVWVNYQDLEIKNTGNSGRVKLETDAIKTTYGSVNAQMDLEKNGEHVYVTKGHVGFEPNLKFYQMIQDQINQKYNIRLTGTPSFENGELKLQGELRSKIGLVQWADFSIKAHVVDNKLVFDLDKAHILKVIGKGAIGDAANAILSKTDIDVFRKGPGTIEIALADIVKDLALTEGVNFTGLKLVDNRFEVGFVYDSNDLEVGRLAKQKNVAGLKTYLASQPIASLSGESISTAYNTYIEGKDTPAASKLLLDTLKAYAQVRESNQLERALLWMSKSHVAHKQDVDDDIALDVLRQLKLDTPAGQQLVQALPQEIVRNLADNLDKTISQGGGFSWIRPEERDLANRLRALKGLPLNHRII